MKFGTDFSGRSNKTRTSGCYCGHWEVVMVVFLCAFYILKIKFGGNFIHYILVNPVSFSFFTFR